MSIENVVALVHATSVIFTNRVKLDGTSLISITINVLASASSVSSFRDDYWCSELSTVQGELSALERFQEGCLQNKSLRAKTHSLRPILNHTSSRHKDKDGWFTKRIVRAQETKRSMGSSFVEMLVSNYKTETLTKTVYLTLKQ